MFRRFTKPILASISISTATLYLTSPPPHTSINDTNTTSAPSTNPFVNLLIKPWTTSTTTQCYVQTRHSNSLPDTNHPISHAQLQRTKTKERQEDASTTVEDIENHGFEIQGLLGQGSFGLVYGAKIMQELTMIDTMAKSYQIGDRVAIKRMSKRGLLRSVDVDDYHSEDSQRLDNNVTSSYQKELNGLKQIGSHSNICGLIGTFETNSAYYIILELVEGPPLFDWIIDHGVFFRESTASTCLKQIVKGLEHIHSKQVCHNDLKPENIIVGIHQKILLNESSHNPDDLPSKYYQGNNDPASSNINIKNSELNLKIVDFGMSHILKKEQNASEEIKGGNSNNSNNSIEEQQTYNMDETIVGGPGEGTFAYWSPEMMEGKLYGRPSDLWALGVTLYIALCGIHPFDPQGISTDQEIMNDVRLGNYNTDGVIWKNHLSQDAKNIIQQLLVVDPKKRKTAKELLKMKWFTKYEEGKEGEGEGEGCEGGGKEENINEENEETIKEISAMRGILIQRTSQRLKEEENKRKDGDVKEKEKGGWSGWW